MIAVYTCTCDKVKTKKYYTCIRLIRYNIRGARVFRMPRRDGNKRGKRKKGIFVPILLKWNAQADRIRHNGHVRTRAYTYYSIYLIPIRVYIFVSRPEHNEECVLTYPVGIDVCKYTI